KAAPGSSSGAAYSSVRAAAPTLGIVAAKYDARIALPLNRSTALPDLYPVFRSDVHLVRRLNVECLVECIVVHERHERAVHTGRVRIGQQLVAQSFVPEFRAPDLREADE